MIDDQPACLPPGFAIDEDIFFSPGIACPSGYQTACMDTSGENSRTTVTCCPVYGPETTLSCHQNPETIGERWESLFCTWRATRSGAVLTWTESGLGTETTTLEPPGGVNAYGIRMIFESTDLGALPSATETSTSSIDRQNREGDSAGPTPSEQDSSSNEAANTDPASAGASGGDDGGNISDGDGSTTINGGLGQAGTIAIAVVVPVLAVLAALGFFLWWRGRRLLGAKGQGPQDAMAIHSHPDPGQPGYYSGSYAKPMPPTYGRAELPDGYAGAELSGVHSASEMPANGQRRQEMW